MPRSIWLLVIGMAVSITGSSFLWPLNAIYIHDHLGKTLTVAGVVLLLNQAASVLGNLVGGAIFDKLGGYRSMLLGVSISLFAAVGLFFWHGWPHYVYLLIILGFGSGIIIPAMYAMAGSVWPEGGRKAFNALYVAQNLGVAIGSALGGFVAAYRFDYTFMANALLFIMFFLIAVIGYRTIQVQTVDISTSVIKNAGPVKNYTKLTALLILCFGYMLCWIGYVQWQSTIATYTQDLSISLEQYSLLWTVNGALIVLAQPLLAMVVKVLKSIKLQIVVGMIIFIISFLMVGTADEYAGFLSAMIILTFGEMLVWPAVPTIAHSLAPKGREGFYQGIVNSTATCGRMLGPLFGGIMVDQYGMEVLFIALVILCVIGIFTTLLYDRKLKKTEVQHSSMSANV
ncbi:predicted MFS family arabinose efflux permease [Bacillus oleivorans]|uniref:Predicted MFS family arabinose efflux permease n=1 Tax=Bacillus oleivorans TaxID=1448271 RepID=A0A285CUR8_9BACI|nr:MFS transporter [Bacillus oleivorans]SNX71292.1 predicted MFS family arabinose efflux permease [Bacillus oleivorans]